MRILMLRFGFFLFLLCPSLAWGQKTTVEVIPPSPKQVGERITSDPIDLGGASSLRVTFLETGKKDFDKGAETYIVEVELSDDGGQTWRSDTKADFVGSTRARGGNKHYLELTAQQQTPMSDGTIRAEKSTWKGTKARVVLTSGRPQAEVGLKVEVTR